MQRRGRQWPTQTVRTKELKLEIDGINKHTVISMMWHIPSILAIDYKYNNLKTV